MNSIGIDQIVDLGSSDLIDQKTLECSICYCIVSDPLECKNKKCRKIYCSGCINTANNNTLNKVCPFCRTTNQLALIDENVYLILNTLKVYCLQNSCKQSMSIKDYKKHIEDCLYNDKHYKHKEYLCFDCQKPFGNIKYRCNICSKQYCNENECKNKISSCFKCKGIVCYACLPSSKKSFLKIIMNIKSTDTKIVSSSKYIPINKEGLVLKINDKDNPIKVINFEFLCGMCDVSCQKCNIEEANDLCFVSLTLLCNKPTCSQNIAIHSLADNSSLINKIFNTNNISTFSSLNILNFLPICKDFYSKVNDYSINKNIKATDFINTIKQMCFLNKCSWCISNFAKISVNINSQSFKIEALIKIKLTCDNCNKKCEICNINSNKTSCHYCDKKICISLCSVKCKNCRLSFCKNKEETCYSKCIVCKENYCSNCLLECSNCNGFKICKNCPNSVLKSCSACNNIKSIDGDTKKNNKELLCFSCWNVCNYCEKLFCAKHSNHCILCEDTSCLDHTYDCKICSKEGNHKVCYKKCSYKCSFCSNESSALCKRTNIFDSKMKNYFQLINTYTNNEVKRQNSNLSRKSHRNKTLQNLEEKKKNLLSNLVVSKNNNDHGSNLNVDSKSKGCDFSYISSHPYVAPLACNHNVCEACVRFCAKCPSSQIAISCPQCVAGYYYHYCRNCDIYLCNLCSKYCKVCEESYCTSCICEYCNKKSDKCKNCFYLKTVLKCSKCNQRNEICNDCRRIYLCGETCYLRYANLSKKIGNHICDMFFCTKCVQTQAIPQLPIKEEKEIIEENSKQKTESKIDINLIKQGSSNLNYYSDVKANNNLVEDKKSNIEKDSKIRKKNDDINLSKKSSFFEDYNNRSSFKSEPNTNRKYFANLYNNTPKKPYLNNDNNFNYKQNLPNYNTNKTSRLNKNSNLGPHNSNSFEYKTKKQSNNCCFI